MEFRTVTKSCLLRGIKVELVEEITSAVGSRSVTVGRRTCLSKESICFQKKCSLYVPGGRDPFDRNSIQLIWCQKCKKTSLVPKEEYREGIKPTGHLTCKCGGTTKALLPEQEQRYWDTVDSGADLDLKNP
jgi:hypothetical protein